jgi:hypothetical protein
MDDSAKLLAIEEIKQLKARYFRLMDQKDWEAIPAVFAPDVVCDFSGAMRDPADPSPPDAPDEPPLVGRGAVVRFMQAGLAHARSVHHGHMAEIAIESEDRASGIFAMFDRLRFSRGPLRALDGYGHYFETYRKVDGQWRIATLKLVRLQVDTVQA